MAKLKKAEVIAALTEKGVTIPEGMKYNELCKLLKEAAMTPSLGQAENCDDVCTNWEYCKKEGNTGRFAPGATCPDRSEPESDETPDEEAKPEIADVFLKNRKKKNNMFYGDSIRDEADRNFLNNELRKLQYKGKVKRVTTIKHYDPIDGDWVTEFMIELKG